MARIAQIIPYFGKWPEWMELYLYSCSRNQMVDFILFTDCPTDQLPQYPNVKFIGIQQHDYENVVSFRLGIDYHLETPYKLTDLKPFLGLIHQAELIDYDWWGFGDIDLVYGDLSSIFSDRNLARYDLLTTHNYHIAGHFTFMRNNDYYRKKCLSIKDWSERLGAAEHFGFDEAEWSNLIYPSIRYPLTIYSKIISKIESKAFNPFMDTANSLIHPRELFKEFHTSPCPKDGEMWTYDCCQNKIFAPEKKELPYLHFLFFKKTKWLNTDKFWKDGYWRIDKEISSYSKILFNNQIVEGELRNA